ncbi:MAG: ABC transporter permease subunit/CPBP intramembrane protease [Planctomycetota bacterium]
MTFPQRIQIIYRKELIEVLRDRRTLIAMIVVPIVLYPLLMVGSIQAVTFQAESLQRAKLVIGVTSESQEASLRSLVEYDAKELAQLESERPLGGESLFQLPESLMDWQVHRLDNQQALEEAIQQRQVHVGLLFEDEVLTNSVDRQNNVMIFADQEEARSAAASRRLTQMLERVGKSTARIRLESVGLSRVFVEPFLIRLTNLAAPPSILGQILPLVLVLMTITGAIYPAIDLTAGERERGTLESVMVCPVPIIDLIAGKFLVVTTIAILGAALNLASVSATIYFGGFGQVLGRSGGSIPIGKMLFVLGALIPFAVLMSAIMMAVCCFARTFKEAQNYVTPVILAVLIPGGLAALPATRLEGAMLVMPVGNMVLLAREVLVGAIVPVSTIAIVLLSTSLYAVAAVAVAANLFGQETVLFTDVGSPRAIFSRRWMKPKDYPTVPMSLLLVALLFPPWFFFQSSLTPRAGDDVSSLFHATAAAMPFFFVLIPLAVLHYAKVNLGNALSLKTTSARCWLAAILLGVSSWVPAHVITVTQQALLPLPTSVLEALAKFQTGIEALPPWLGLLYLALIPAICEESLFRGVLLGGLLTRTRALYAILAAAAIFGVFHFVAFRFPPTFALGIVLGYLCWRSGSIFPPMLAHFLHNGLSISEVYWPWHQHLGIPTTDQIDHLPGQILIVGAVVFFLGLVLCRSNSLKNEGSLQLPGQSAR